LETDTKFREEYIKKQELLKSVSEPKTDFEPLPAETDDGEYVGAVPSASSLSSLYGKILIQNSNVTIHIHNV
jgi:hypothetical protein